MRESSDIDNISGIDYIVSYDQVIKHGRAFTVISELTEDHVREIWSYDTDLMNHIIAKYRSETSIVFFINRLDPFNKRRLFSFFGAFFNDEVGKVLNLYLTIQSMFCNSHALELNIEQSWKDHEMNSIKFFNAVDEDVRRRLIEWSNRYQK